MTTKAGSSPVVCRGIFSVKYLSRHFRNSEHFPTAEEVSDCYEAAKARWRDNLPGLRRQNEAYTRTIFLDPLLADLGWHFSPTGDITLVGLVAEGGQGMRTANTARFLGYLEGTPQANGVLAKREE